ncbi:cobyrinate a,c-diamide synthase [Limimaricola cinnabarinus]|jgi:cobyrinic acid a,c-diamide synthase|uniref:Hydrogenobyrinate a,c-diamide synthase n=1 Tax=Limimaricola cinnabarinus TaxID=1125964 RepID=A0A2G1MKC2_9RHOB|nr:cobyrinate a,c-diamide synthase [Limimaricola cinnabarinus]PHP29203.1 cobyrinic acid a,c-diamide synthase [Limimaricola cinnabarinus]
MPGLLIAAPSSGSGKTTVTLGLLRAWARRGVAVRGAKSGPDYIDPRFHEAACGAPCFNLDAWAMGPDRIVALAGGSDTLVVEGAMGLFDGAPPEGRGASADLARMLGLPVVLVIDAARMAQSVAPLVAGFAGFDPAVSIGGVILNRVGSPRHEAMLRRALSGIGVKVLGAVPRDAQLAHPSRHLGLVQAHERPDLDAFLDCAADLVEGHLDLDGLAALASTAAAMPSCEGPRLSPPAQRIALAQDRAFAFAYPHLLADWRSRGAEILPFSPLADEAVPKADLVLLPGGYPELHAGRLAAADTFMQSLRNAPEANDIYGECGGYMVLGECLTDAEGRPHRMAGLLRLSTSFATRKLHLGYRQVKTAQGPFAGAWAAHEFHYATTVSAEGDALFEARDAEGMELPPMGLREGRVFGSFAHLIDRA